MGRTLRLLMVEDSAPDAELLVRGLVREGYEVVSDVVQTIPTMRTALEREDWDVITSDHAMPQCSAPAALALAKALCPTVPFIIVSGEIDVNLAVSLMREGAQDFVQKSELIRLGPAIARELRDVDVRRERRHVKDALQRSETRYRRLFETAQDGILILDADTGQILDVNPFLTTMLGYTKASCLGKRLWELGAFKDAEASIRAFRALQTEGYARYDDLPLESSTGRRIAVEFVSNVYDVDLARVAQCNIRDITARKQADAALAHAKSELEQRVFDRTVELESLNADLETFSYTVSHDLRAPLRHIIGFTEALRVDFASEHTAGSSALIERIATSADRMNDLIGALLELARVTRRELRRQPVDLGSIARAVAAELAQADPARKVEVVVGDGLVAEGDPELLRVVVENLMSNAWRFTAHEATAHIEVGTAPQADGSLAYFVRDDGAGFDMAYEARLWKPFQRLHSEEEFPGIGIGLATVQRIILRHDGRVWATGAVGHGATVFFTVGDPLVRRKAPPPPLTATAPHDAA